MQFGIRQSPMDVKRLLRRSGPYPLQGRPKGLRLQRNNVGSCQGLRASNTREGGSHVTALPREQSSLMSTRLTIVRGKDHVLRDLKTKAASVAVPVTTPVEAPECVAEPQFSWAKQWYPFVPVEYLDATRPHPVSLLGRDLVIWRDGAGTWRCFEDFCPHRHVPLSEGRIEADGNLLCSYHAWRFNGEGKCVDVPQARDQEDKERICNSTRSRASVHPTKVIHGLLWIWGESGDVAILESAVTPPRIIPELEEDKSGLVMGLTWSFRDIPHGADYFFENVLDGAHVPVSHHNIIGNRYTDAVFFQPEMVGEVSPKDGFTFRVPPTIGEAPKLVSQSTTTFQPPCLVRSDVDYKEGGRLTLVLYATPTKPGWCRHVGCQMLTKKADGTMPRGFGFFALPLPAWLNHVTTSLFLHQDLGFLHQQEKKAARLAGGAAKPKKYFMPIESDQPVTLLRQWMDKYSGGVPQMTLGDSTALPPPASKAELYDFYNVHVRHCASCQLALKRLTTARLAAIAAAAALVLSGVVITATTAAARAASLAAGGAAADAAAGAALLSLPPGGALAALAAAVLLGGTVLLINTLIALFHKYEFSHADNN